MAKKLAFNFQHIENDLAYKIMQLEIPENI